MNCNLQTEFLGADYANNYELNFLARITRINCADWDVAGPVTVRLAASLPFLDVALAQSAGSARVVTKETRRRVAATSLEYHTNSIRVVIRVIRGKKFSCCWQFAVLRDEACRKGAQKKKKLPLEPVKRGLTTLLKMEPKV
jgi:hypothetical protein